MSRNLRKAWRNKLWGKLKYIYILREIALWLKVPIDARTTVALVTSGTPFKTKSRQPVSKLVTLFTICSHPDKIAYFTNKKYFSQEQEYCIKVIGYFEILLITNEKEDERITIIMIFIKITVKWIIKRFLHVILIVNMMR